MERHWFTDDAERRPITVIGRSALDPDCLVAHYDDTPDKVLWIVEPSGFICDDRGFGSPQLCAKPVNHLEASIAKEDADWRAFAKKLACCQ